MDMKQTTTRENEMQGTTYAERQAARAEQFVQKVAEAYGFTPEELVETSAFTSWEDCSGQWGYTGDAYGYWQESIRQAAHALKHKRGTADRLREREERAHRNGGEVCQRCGGCGGHSSWPGWVCFDCSGRGWL